MNKLLIIHHCSGIGGAGLSLIHIIKAIDCTKYQIYVQCPNNPSEMIELLQNENCTVIPLDKPPAIFKHYNGGIKSAFSLKTLKNTIEILKDKNRMFNSIKDVSPDILIVNSMTMFWVGKIAKKLGLRTVCFHRETYQDGFLGFRSNIIKQGLSKWFDRVAFISNFDLVKTGEIKGEKHLIYDRVDLSLYNHFTAKEARDMLNLNEDDKYVLFLGGLSTLKGADVIIDAMRHIKNKKIKLLFVGDIESLDELDNKGKKSIRGRVDTILGNDFELNLYNLIKNNSMEDKIVFKKRSAQPELFYSACNLIIFPSTLAHQSRPIYEAGIAKIPIIITDFPETEEFAKNEITAITFSNRNSVELAEKIEKIIDGKINIDEIVENNYKQSIKNHDLSDLKNNIEKILDFNI